MDAPWGPPGDEHQRDHGAADTRDGDSMARREGGSSQCRSPTASKPTASMRVHPAPRADPVATARKSGVASGGPRRRMAPIACSCIAGSDDNSSRATSAGRTVSPTWLNCASLSVSRLCSPVKVRSRASAATACHTVVSRLIPARRDRRSRQRFVGVADGLQRCKCFDRRAVHGEHLQETRPALPGVEGPKLAQEIVKPSGAVDILGGHASGSGRCPMR